MSSGHLISRLSVVADISGDEAAGLRLQRQLSEYCNHALPSKLAKLLEQHDQDTVHLVLDRVEIDAGTLELDHLEESLTERILEQVDEVLRHRETSSVRARATAEEAGAALQLSAREARIAALLHYLKQGQLPWWFSIRDRSFAHEVHQLLQSRPHDPREYDAILSLLGSSATARMRAAEWLSGAAVLELLRLKSVSWAEVLAVGLGKARKAMEHGCSIAFETALIRVALDLGWDASDSGSPVAQGTLTGLVLAALSHMQPTQRAKALPFIRSVFDLPSDLNIVGLDRPEIELSEPDEALSDGMVLSNAGVALIHPFLPRFLETLGVAKDGQLLDLDRALLLVHHLASGESSAEDIDLGFAKVLCGLDTRFPARRQDPIREHEFDECEILLQAVLEHWGALGSTSPTGLRENFLKRSGKLTSRSGELVLRMEWKSYDILLDQLPWGLHLIQLPWMKTMLRVEWLP